MGLKDIVGNTLKDYKATLGSGLLAAITSGSISYLVPDLKGNLEYLVSIGLPSIAAASLGFVIDKKNKRIYGLNKILDISDHSRETGVLSFDSDGNIKNFIGGKGRVFEELNFRAKPGENIKEKYSNLDKEVAEFLEKARIELIKRYERAKKDSKILEKFSSKKAYGSEDSITGRCIKFNDTFGDEYVKTTYDLDAFLSQDNKTVKVKGRRDIDKSKIDNLNHWLDSKVIKHLKVDSSYYKYPVTVPTACLYCDIRGFTSFTDSHNNQEVADLTKDYYVRLIGAANAFDATFDKVVGDEILLLFGPPYDDVNPHPSMKSPCYHAITAALKMREVFKSVKKDYDIGIGIGIDFGNPFVGIYDFRKGATYTGIGPSMNAGARLCSEDKSGETIISENVFRQLYREKGFVDVKNIISRTEEAGKVKVKGIKDEINIYKVK